MNSWKNGNTKPDIYDLLDTLTPEMKEQLLEYLVADIRSAKSAPPKTYLEEQWEDIERLLKNLDYEPHLDDQFELLEIMDICEELINSGELENEPTEIRQKVIDSIISNDMYNSYGVDDYMSDLLNALIITPEEKLRTADAIFENGSDRMKKEWSEYYKRCDRQEQYFSYVEQHLNDKQKPYLELIDYCLKEGDRDRAVRIAEQGLKKCRDDQTELVTFLIRRAREDGNEKREMQLLRGARARRAVNMSRVTEMLGGGIIKD